jgi:hypothetical protein
MRVAAVQDEKWQGERVNEGVEGAFIPHHPENSR